MNEYYLKKLLIEKEELIRKLEEYKGKEQISVQEPDKEEIKGHIHKAEHNIKFVEDTSKKAFSDWVLVGCYYTLYHTALALILQKGYASKNHDATLCLLIKEYYKQISNDEIELINFTFLTKEDFFFYAESKNKREEASYSTKTIFEDINKIIIKTRLFLNKTKEMIETD